MLAKRIIPCLDVHDGRTTRGQQFGRAEEGGLRDVGDPVELAVRYDAQGADELVFYDITATAHGRSAMLDVATRVAERCFMPLTVGGGVRTFEDVRTLFLAGADKVSINSGAVADPELLTRASEHFGAQAVVLSIDARKRSGESGWEVFVSGGRTATGLDLEAWAVRGQALGAGEIVLNSIDADGMKTGYDVAATRLVARAVDIPVVASGGAGAPEHMVEVLGRGEADAALAAGMFHSGRYTVGGVKRVLAEAGLHVRQAHVRQVRASSAEPLTSPNPNAHADGGGHDVPLPDAVARRHLATHRLETHRLETPRLETPRLETPRLETRHLETIAVHGGAEVDPASGAVTPPIHLSTTFERERSGGYPHGWVYGRTENPTRARLESLLAELEGGADAAAFASGSAAASAVFRALRPGDHALVPDDMYHGLRTLLREAIQPWGLELSVVDMTDLDAVQAALRPETRLFWVETPSNPLLKITDVAQVSAVAREVGATLAVDATWTPPSVQESFALGADLVVHATTKYLAGHSDVIGGAVVARRPDGIFERIRFLQRNEGAVPSPFDCWLVMRGIRTLPYRMRGHCAGARHVAEFLDAHPRVTRVHYPGLASHPRHEVAARQMREFGGMVSFRVAGGEDAAMAVAAGARLFTRATSLGGVESLIEHRASIEGPESATPRDLLRVSVGLEHPDDLVEDLRAALEA